MDKAPSRRRGRPSRTGKRRHENRRENEINKAAMSRLAMIIIASTVPSRNMLQYTLTQRCFLSHCDRDFSLAQQRMQERLIDEMNLQ